MVIPQWLISIQRVLRFLFFNIPIIFIGIVVIKYPEMITDDIQKLLLGFITILVGLKDEVK